MRKQQFKFFLFRIHKDKLKNITLICETAADHNICGSIFSSNTIILTKIISQTKNEIGLRGQHAVKHCIQILIISLYTEIIISQSQRMLHCYKVE